MRNPFQYSVLYYQPSQYLEEKYSIGLLFLFPHSKEIVFISPESLQRLTTFLVDFDSVFFRKLFKRFTAKAKVISTSWKETGINFEKFDFTEIINNEFLIPDSSSLKFSLPKSGLIPDNNQTLINYYQNLFFKNYTFSGQSERVDEPKIINRFSQLVKKKIAAPDRIIKANVLIEGEYFVEKFDYAWQNGKYNLITPLSFDLSKTDNIKKKSQQQIGVLSNIAKTIEENNYNINFLLAKPSKKELFKDYENALGILEGFQKKMITRIIDIEIDIQQYIEEINDTAKPLS